MTKQFNSDSNNNDELILQLLLFNLYLTLRSKQNNKKINTNTQRFNGYFTCETSLADCPDYVPHHVFKQNFFRITGTGLSTGQQHEST